MKQCIVRKQKSESYEMAQHYLDTIKRNYDIAYIYIVLPLNEEKEDNMMYVMTGTIPNEEEIDGYVTTLGDLSGTEYSVNVVKNYLGYMQDTTRTIHYYANKTSFGYMYTGSVTIFDNAGTPVAVLSIDISMDEVYHTMWKYISIVVAGGLFISVLFIVIQYFWLKRRIIQPLSKIERAARTFAFTEHSHHAQEGEELSYQDPQICTGDEIQSLSDAYVQMAKDLNTYMKNMINATREKERIGAELDVATRIQASMLPRIFPLFPEREEFEVFASMIPAKEVGGDFYDCFMVDPDNIAVVVADVSGKGVPAALFMVIGKTLIKDHTLPEKDLGEVFTEVNDILCESNSEQMFITAFEAVLNLKTGELRYVNAGHEIPFICRKNGTFEQNPVRAGFILAGMEGIRYRAGSIQLEPGDKLFQYTDGVPEATNSKDELFGMERLEQTLAKVSAQKPTEILERVKADVDAFVGEREAFDDLTMLCLEYKKRKTDKNEKA